jgi:hypothetical protein
LENIAEKECEVTKFFMGVTLLIILESCKYQGRDAIGRAWIEGLQTVGIGREVVEGLMKSAKKLGKAAMGGVRRKRRRSRKLGQKGGKGGKGGRI